MKNKNVLVVGLGVSGLATSRLLLSKGASLWVTEREDNPQTRSLAEDLTRQGAIVELGRHTEGFVKGKDLIVVSPGVKPDSEVIKWADRYGIQVISELELASRYVTCPLVCVTGTNGKSTVTSLIDHIFRCTGRNSIGCGNLGMPLSEVVLLNKEFDFAVVEVSSFQLEYIKDFRPTVSVWLNFSYDHLDHHLSMEEYLRAKLRIFENQTKEDWAVINYRELDKVGNIRAKKIIYGKEGGLENIEAAITTARILGISEDAIMDAIRAFRPLPHRMQYVDTFGGMDFIDDSKGTNVHAVIYALDRISRPIVLILGGRDKGDDFTRLKELIIEKVSCVVVFGEAKDKIVRELNGIVPIHTAQTLEDAVGCAYNNATFGATVLLSPGCSSFDMFRDYKERGEKFQKAVVKLREMCLDEK